MHWIQALLAATLAWMIPPGGEASVQSRAPEYRVKAQFILAIPAYVQWPSSPELENKHRPFVVGTVGHSPFELYLIESVRDQRILSKTIQLKACRTLQETENCNMLFICSSEQERLKEILAQIGNRPILTVCDFPQGAQRGVIVNLLTVDEQVQMDINRSVAKAKGMDFSSHLLKIVKNIY